MPETGVLYIRKSKTDTVTATNNTLTLSYVPANITSIKKNSQNYTTTYTINQKVLTFSASTTGTFVVEYTYFDSLPSITGKSAYATAVENGYTGTETQFGTDLNTAVSGTIGIARGGTGKTSWTANGIIYPSGSTTLTQLAPPTTAGSVLRQGQSGAPYWTTVAALSTEIMNYITDGDEVNY